jgi:hypothetical protein
MLELPPLAKAPVALNAVPVAILVIVVLWAARRLAKLALLLLVLAAVVAGLLWVRGGL